MISPAVKYGGGGKTIQEFLTITSSAIDDEEAAEKHLSNAQEILSSLDNLKDYDKQQQEIADTQMNLNSLKQETFKLLRHAIDHTEIFKGENDDLSD